MKKRVIKTPVKMVARGEVKTKQEVETVKADFRNYLNTYDFPIELVGSKQQISITPLTTGQIKNLLTMEGQEEDLELMTKIFDRIITESVLTDGFDLAELYLQDRFYLLLEIRKKTKGAIHKFEYTCEECGSQTLNTVNLDKLPIDPFPDEIQRIIKINDDISVEMDLLKRRDEFEAVECLKVLKSQTKFTALQEQAEFALLLEAAGIRRIIMPEGEQTEEDLSLFDKKYFLENIPKFLYQKIKDWYSRYDFGVDFRIDIKCDHCGDSKKIEIPYDNFFF